MTQNVPGLKVLVIVMGALIVAGLGVLAVTVVQRASELDLSPEYATGAIALPLGQRVRGMVADGDVLTLLVDHGDGGQSLVTLDRRSGQVLGTLTLGEAP